MSLSLAVASPISAIEEGYITYVLPTSGSLELKAAIGDKLKRDNGLESEPDQILVTCGAFGSDSHMRLSYACSMEEITEGMDRIEKAITVLS